MQMSSPSGKEEGGSEVHQLLVKLEKVSAELLEEKKRSLELHRELAAEKQQNKRVRTGMIELDKAGVNLGSSSTLQTQLRIQSARSEDIQEHFHQSMGGFVDGRQVNQINQKRPRI